MTLASHIPALLRRARAILDLHGGPPDDLERGEVARAARAVEELHEGLVGERLLARPETYRGRRLGAYLLWWWPQTYLKMRATLALAPLPRGARVVDLGSGPGPAALAARDALGANVLAVDASEAALAEARALGVAETRRIDLDRDEPPAADVYLAANVLLELPQPLALVRKLRGHVVLVEPALRETGRALLTLRDTVLAEQRFQALAPCLTQRPCPALASPKDWCTMDLPWDPPPWFSRLAQATGLRADEKLSFAPLVLGPSAPPAPEGSYRVVGEPPREKGKRRLFVCNDEGRVPVARLDRERSEANAAFDDAHRGDLIRLRGVEQRGDGLRITGASRVDRD